MANERTLEIAKTGAFAASYSNIEPNADVTTLEDNLIYDGLNFTLSNGSEAGQCDLFYHEIVIVLAGGTTIDLDGGITNKWGDTLDFFRTKYILIKSLETASSGNIIEVTFGAPLVTNCQIGPQGYREMYEPDGLQSNTTSSLGEETTILFNGGDGVTDMTCEIFIAGTSAETNISSGL